MQKLPTSCRPSYTPTSWPIVNRTLDIVDRVTNGRADWVQRFFSYSFIGGLAALVNLTIFSILYHFVAMPVSDIAHNLIAQVIACEISLMANFIPNDYFTFRHLAGHSRSWGARCLRYHITSIAGFCLTTLIESVWCSHPGILFSSYRTNSCIYLQFFVSPYFYLSPYISQ
jgi:putative flippase GtrA